MSQIEDAIEEFGQPHYQYTSGSIEKLFWFNCNLMLEFKSGYSGYFTYYRLIDRKRWFKPSGLYNDKGTYLKANVQAKWEMYKVDDIILGNNDG